MFDSGIDSSSRRGSSKLSLRRRKRIRTIFYGFVITLVSLAALFFAWQYYDLEHNPGKLASQQATGITEQVGQLIILPTGETPTVATVEDASKLSSQPFFKDAQNGDQILIYAQSKRAIIYRPSERKLVNVGPMTINLQQ